MQAEYCNFCVKTHFKIIHLLLNRSIHSTHIWKSKLILVIWMKISCIMNICDFFMKSRMCENVWNFKDLKCKFLFMHTECAQKINVKTRFFCIFTALCKKQIFFYFYSWSKMLKWMEKEVLLKLTHILQKSMPRYNHT